MGNRQAQEMMRKSRRERFEEAKAQASIAREEIDSLRDELQNWLDNLPENLQSGSKAEELEEAISRLEEVLEFFDEIESAEVEFPGMYP
jgi:predicted translin family RNA/ssDNA-binding protein